MKIISVKKWNYLPNTTSTTFFLPFQHFYYQKEGRNVDFLLTLGHQKNIEWRAKHNMFHLQRISDNYNTAKD